MRERERRGQELLTSDVEFKALSKEGTLKRKITTTKTKEMTKI